MQTDIMYHKTNHYISIGENLVGSKGLLIANLTKIPFPELTVPFNRCNFQSDNQIFIYSFCSNNADAIENEYKLLVTPNSGSGFGCYANFGDTGAPVSKLM